MIGFIKLHRQLLEWEWYDDIPVRLTFFHFLLKANYKSKNWQGIEIKRGQLIVGTNITSEQIGISKQKYRTALKKLKKSKEINIQSTNKYTLITIVNYGKFQDNNITLTNKQHSTNKQLTNEQHSTNIPSTTTKEDNNIITKEIKKRESEKSLTPLEIIKTDLVFWEGFQMKNKRQIKDWDKMILDWECKVEIENLEWNFKTLKARLEIFCRNWLQNQSSFNKKQKKETTLFATNRK